MSLVQQILLAANTALIFAVLAGLFARRRARLCLSFAAYLAVVVVTGSLVLLFPVQFFVWSFYLAKEFALNLLKLLIVLEVAVRVFHPFTAARRAAVGALVLVLGITLAAVVMAPTDEAFQNADHNA